MIFQDPRAHINPMRRVGEFMIEALRDTLGVSAPTRATAVDGSSKVGIDDRRAACASIPTSCPAACCSAS